MIYWNSRSSVVHGEQTSDESLTTWPEPWVHCSTPLTFFDSWSLTVTRCVVTFIVVSKRSVSSSTTQWCVSLSPKCVVHVMTWSLRISSLNLRETNRSMWRWRRTTARVKVCQRHQLTDQDSFWRWVRITPRTTIGEYQSTSIFFVGVEVEVRQEVSIACVRTSTKGTVKPAERTKTFRAPVWKRIWWLVTSNLTWMWGDDISGIVKNAYI